jgi:hypothetical protein
MIVLALAYAVLCDESAPHWTDDVWVRGSSTFSAGDTMLKF